ncbi:MAG: hypothetical protein WCK82_14645, partial [Bacteroidota bacterium]
MNFSTEITGIPQPLAFFAFPDIEDSSAATRTSHPFLVTSLPGCRPTFAARASRSSLSIFSPLNQIASPV